MKRVFLCRLSLFIIGVMAVALCSCAGSTSSKFYALSPVKGPDSVKHVASADRGVIVEIGPLAIPDYLDRPQIVTRSSRNELKVDEFHRWAGSLENDITRVLIENLSAMLPADRYSVIRWIPLTQPEIQSGYRVAVDIIHFDGTYSDSVSVKARWSVFRKDGGAPVVHESDIVEQVKGVDQKALVEAMSRAMESLSRDIADTITSPKD